VRAGDLPRKACIIQVNVIDICHNEVGRIVGRIGQLSEARRGDYALQVDRAIRNVWDGKGMDDLDATTSRRCHSPSFQHSLTAVEQHMPRSMGSYSHHIARSTYVGMNLMMDLQGRTRSNSAKILIHTTPRLVTRAGKPWAQLGSKRDMIVENGRSCATKSIASRSSRPDGWCTCAASIHCCQ
jgi:hypothetical protein